jgi:hypothetical protein
LKTARAKWTDGVSNVLEHRLYKLEDLSSNLIPSPKIIFLNLEVFLYNLLEFLEAVNLYLLVFQLTRKSLERI